ncbi:hypothetical protein DPEC_G00156330 [Dallia pectoralis]|uniref:Uncharacterized protein n=1 Tax=Dallia pectoralis TaxID=75939 RepID=A0ACC2GKN9_DALPE|nr:hypothetical protein DPEC_G00156330 [Dallia pectoralis]
MTLTILVCGMGPGAGRWLCRLCSKKAVAAVVKVRNISWLKLHLACLVLPLSLCLAQAAINAQGHVLDSRAEGLRHVEPRPPPPILHLTNPSRNSLHLSTTLSPGEH